LTRQADKLKLSFRKRRHPSLSLFEGKAMAKHDKISEEDYADRIGQRGSGAEWEMQSFNRVAYIFWDAFAKQLRRKGLTEDQVKYELQSKGTRWMLDAGMERIEQLAESMADDYKLEG
jgi:hypothetical protein